MRTGARIPANHEAPAGARAGSAPLLRIWRQYRDQPNAADAVHETLRDAILGGVLTAGRRLGEVQLATSFQRSRTPVREALLRLTSERLVDRAGRGFVVGRVTSEEILEVYAVREALDALAARLAAQTVLPTELEQLGWLNDRMRRAAERGAYDLMLRLNIEFHEGLVCASRNSIVLQFTRQIHDRVRRFSATTFMYQGRAMEAVAEHDALLAAIGRRDPDEAERIARDHMARARQIRVAMLQSEADDARL